MSSDRVNEMTSLAMFICWLSDSDVVSFRYKSYICKQINGFSMFASLTSFLLLSVIFLILFLTVKWDKYIPVLNSYPTRSFPVGFCAGMLSPKGSRVLCFSLSCSQIVLCVLILVEI